MFSSVYFSLLFFVTLVNCSPIHEDDVLLNEWNEFKSLHGKVYENEETERFRWNIFIENKRKIKQHNELADAGLKSYKLAMNHFGDLLNHEINGKMNGYKKSLKGNLTRKTIKISNSDLPESVDYRNNGYVTPVKDQGHCGSCWAFSAIGSLEGQHFRKTGKLVSLSEQNLVDCSSAYGNEGCNGGLMNQAFEYIKNNSGIDTEESYPYTAKDGKCKFDKKNVGATVEGFIDIDPGNEGQLTAAIAAFGPVSVAIDASAESFPFYSSGVYDEPHCSSTKLDHGVLAIGYGIDKESNKKFYIVKNSWSVKWGNAGYILMSRDKNNQCGIATAASLPLV